MPVKVAKRVNVFGCVEVGSRTRTVRRRLESQSVSVNPNVDGKEGVKHVGEGGSSVHSCLPPLAPNPNPPSLFCTVELDVELEELADP